MTLAITEMNRDYRLRCQRTLEIISQSMDESLEKKVSLVNPAQDHASVIGCFAEDLKRYLLYTGYQRGKYNQFLLAYALAREFVTVDRLYKRFDDANCPESADDVEDLTACLSYLEQQKSFGLERDWSKAEMFYNETIPALKKQFGEETIFGSLSNTAEKSATSLFSGLRTEIAGHYKKVYESLKKLS